MLRDKDIDTTNYGAMKIQDHQLIICKRRKSKPKLNAKKKETIGVKIIF